MRSIDSIMDHLELIRPRADDLMKGSAFVTDALIDPATSHSEELADSPCLRTFKAKSYFDYVYAPGNEYKGARVQAGMNSLATSERSTVVPGGFPWETLPKGTKIVDVGGGVGSASHEIMKENALLKFIIQDLPSVIDQAIAVSTWVFALMSGTHPTNHLQYWNDHEPKAIADGQVTVQAHDFFSPQPINNADLFLLRYILHNWPNAKAIEILKRLREAAVPGKTKVVIIDGVTQYACAVDPKQVRGADSIVFEGSDKKSQVPAGLLPNLGRAEGRNYYLDIGCGLPPRQASDRSFLTKSQDASIVQCARAYAGRLY